MKQTILFFISFLLFTACVGSEGGSDAAADYNDSAKVRIAVMPTLDCLPLYVASERGFFASAGIDVSLRPYQAQMDCDTALERGRVNAIVTNMVRARKLEEKGIGLQVVTATNASWQLVSSKAARIKQLKQLDDKMLAMTRFSATHMLGDLIVDTARLQPERVFRIQINDVGVRLSMLYNNTMDAAFLPEPQATVARNMGGWVLWDSNTAGWQFGIVGFRPQVATEKQKAAFCEAYDRACDSINERGMGYYASLIVRHCGVTQNAVDSLPDVTFRHCQEPREADRKRVSEWMDRNKKTEVANERASR
jgi:NitT/TauT family transport system substrate-binding protein